MPAPLHKAVSAVAASGECATPPRAKPPRAKPTISGLYSPVLPGPTEPDTGEGVLVSDRELVELLRQRPKQVPILRSRDSFRRFFRGIGKSRMEALLNEAYSSLDAEDRMDKVSKRLALLEGVLTS